MPPPAGAALPAPEVAGTAGGFASTLQTMFERAGLGGAGQASQEAAAGPSLREGSVDVPKPVLAATAGAGPDVGAEQCAVAGLPVAGLWVRLECVKPVKAETAGEGQVAVQGERKDGPTQDESTTPLAAGGTWGAILAPEAQVAKVVTAQETSRVPLRDGVEAEWALGIHPGQVELAQRVELRPAATPDELAEVEPQSPARLPEQGSQKEARVDLRPAVTQAQLPVGEQQSQVSVRESGSPREANVEAERNSIRDAGQPDDPGPGSGLAVKAARRDGADVQVRPADRATITEGTQDSMGGRGRAGQRVGPAVQVADPKQTEVWSSVAKNGAAEEPVAISLKAGMRGERAEGRPDNGRSEEQAVGKLTEVERLAGGSAPATRPEVRLTRDGGERLGADRSATGIVRDGGDAPEQRGPGSRGERLTEVRAEAKSGDGAAPVRPGMESTGGPTPRGAEAGGTSGELVASSTPGGRTEGQVNAKPTPAAAPSSPAIRVEAPVDELQEARGAIREIRMTVEPEGGKPIRLRFTESGGQVEVTARSGDPAMTAALRSDLGSLRALGFETVRGVGGLTGPELAAKPEADSGRSGEGGSQESPGHGNPGAGDPAREHRGRNAARWLEAFDRQRDGEWRWNQGERQ